MRTKTQLVIILGLWMTLFSACNEQGETDPEPFQGFVLEGKSYETPKMKLVPLGETATDLYEFDLLLVSEGITLDEDIEGEEGYFLLMKVFSNSENGIEPGTYVFGQDPNAVSIMEGLVVLNFITPATFGNVRPFVSGQLRVVQQAGQAIISYEAVLSDNNKVTGSFKTDWNKWIIQTGS